MRLYVKDKRIILDYSDLKWKKNPYNSMPIPNKAMSFKVKSGYYWDRDEENKSMYLDFTYEDIDGNYEIAKSWTRALACAKLAAEELGIDVAKEYERVKSQAYENERRLYALREEACAKNKAILRWGLLCENGCGGCPKKYRCGDDQFCLASGDLLPETAVPGFKNSVYQLFNYEAFPTENCPYNVNKNQGETA